MKKAICTFLILMGTIIPLASTAQLGDLPSIVFSEISNNLSADARAILSIVAARLKANPKSSIEVIGYVSSSISSSKSSQAAAQHRVNSIRSYLVEKEGIDADRITTDPGMSGGNINTVDLREKDVNSRPDFHGISRGALEKKTPPPLPKVIEQPVAKPKPVKKSKEH